MSISVKTSKPARTRVQRETLHYVSGACSLGTVLVASSAKGVVAVLLGDRTDTLTEDLQARFPHAVLSAGGARELALLGKVVRRIDDPTANVEVPLDVRGTAFQGRVWAALADIASGDTDTYSAIAARLGDPNATRAVAGACAANKIAVLIPCHRVVGKDGAMSGYRWGVDRKRTLLDREAYLGRRAA
ncbi:methylated-DNA--[protein]-cysteine S-methyltransferase [Caulobacter sp. S45]|uniref:methylated-DNA--[protein]-cysteine S-methyltransferase n=1 Tax=Caulobacter sp. S45 TaxID=1641861 RepID=UPI001C2058DD|nr:methylated-DNA--[protein]-cysteine S-methyltransferase [Caulobacter sp. S45]